MKSINSVVINALSAASLTQSLRGFIPNGFKPAASYFCFRKEGKRVFEKWYFSGNLETDLSSALEESKTVFTTLELCFIKNFTAAAVDHLPGDIYRGIKGLRLNFDGESYIIAPSDMLARNIGFAKITEQFYNRRKDKIDAAPANFTAEVFDCYQFIILNGKTAELAPVYRGNQIVSEGEVTRNSTLNLAQSLAGWMFANVAESGSLNYKYWPSAGQYSSQNNTIRQFMGTICLFRAAEFFNNPSMRETAIRNLRYNLSRFLVVENNFAYINEGGKAKLGAAALAAYAIAICGEKEFAAAHDLLFNFTEKMQNADGSFRTFYLPANRNDCQNFYPGECLFYWSLLFENTKSEILKEKILRSFHYYKDWHLKNRNPAFIPWHTQAYFNFLKTETMPEMREFIYLMNDWLLPVQQWDGLKADDAKGRFYDPNRPFGPPHASADGVYMEGLVDAFILADADDRIEQAENYARSIRRAIRSIMQLTFTTEIDTYYISRTERVLGGVRTAPYNNEIRVDNVQHALMAILKLLKTEGFIWPFR